MFTELKRNYATWNYFTDIFQKLLYQNLCQDSRSLAGIRNLNT
jgi:hypothetical protein